MNLITTDQRTFEIKKLESFILNYLYKHKRIVTSTVPRPSKLLDTSGGNTKIKKSSKGTSYRYASLSLLPNQLLCPNSIRANCLGSCLNTAGRGAFTSTQYARALKSYWLMSDPESFQVQLEKELTNYQKTCIKQGLTPAVRLNTISDFNWSIVKAKFDSILFIDYTKVANRLGKALPNEKLVFSYSGEPEYQREVDRALMTSRPIAVVFRNGLPSTFLNRPVIDGDISDIDNALSENVIIGLRAKGKAIKDIDNLFIVDSAAVVS